MLASQPSSNVHSKLTSIKRNMKKLSIQAFCIAPRTPQNVPASMPLRTAESGRRGASVGHFGDMRLGTWLTASNFALYSLTDLCMLHALIFGYPLAALIPREDRRNLAADAEEGLIRPKHVRNNTPYAICYILHSSGVGWHTEKAEDRGQAPEAHSSYPSTMHGREGEAECTHTSSQQISTRTDHHLNPGKV